MEDTSSKLMGTVPYKAEFVDVFMPLISNPSKDLVTSKGKTGSIFVLFWFL